MYIVKKNENPKITILSSEIKISKSFQRNLTPEALRNNLWTFMKIREKRFFLLILLIHCQKFENSNLYISKTVKGYPKHSNGSEFKGAKLCSLKKLLVKLFYFIAVHC